MRFIGREGGGGIRQGGRSLISTIASLWVVTSVRLLSCCQEEQQESSGLKRPANAYIQFVQKFRADNLAQYGNVSEAISAGKWQP